VLAHFEKMGIPVGEGSNIMIPLEEVEMEFTDEYGKTVRQSEQRVIRDLDKLEEVIRKARPVLVVIDPIVRFIRFRELNAYEKTYADLEPLIRLAVVYN